MQHTYLLTLIGGEGSATADYANNNPIIYYIKPISASEFREAFLKKSIYIWIDCKKIESSWLLKQQTAHKAYTHV